jgi:hypothetical protein
VLREGLPLTGKQEQEAAQQRVLGKMALGLPLTREEFQAALACAQCGGPINGPIDADEVIASLGQVFCSGACEEKFWR